MRAHFAILLGKAVFKLTRILNFGGGSAAPGLFALRIDPELVEGLASKIPTNIVITGTNGKTTTSRMLSHFAKQAGLKVIRNHTGSNLERGIASTLVTHYELGTMNYDLGIWELDEAAFNTVAPKLNPKVIVFLNAFRDQLDRYGEVDTVVKKWGETLKRIDKNTLILVNGDDANTKKLSKYFKGKIQMFGVKDYKIIGESIEKKAEKENLDLEAKNVKLKGLSGSSFQLQTTTYNLPVTLPLPGIYHIYDFLGSFGAGLALGFNPKKMISSLNYFSPAFGRVEKLDFGYIFLIKNPAGATQVFETLAPQIQKNDRLLLALNDNLADGTDVSWIWDAQWERLLTSVIPAKAGIYKNGSSGPKSGMTTVVSGTRAFDLANRLKYAGFEPKSITVEPDLKQALKHSRRGLKGKLFILPTYTAMLELQNILAQLGIKKHYWKEDQ